MTLREIAALALGILLCILCIRIYRHFANKNIYYAEDELNEIAERRQKFANSVVELVCKTWLIPADDIEMDVQSVADNVLLITLGFKDFTYHIYFDWKKEKITMLHSFRPLTKPDKRIQHKQVFSMKNGIIDFNSIDDALSNWRTEFMTTLYKDEEEHFVTCLGSATEIAADPDLTNEKALAMLFNAWHDMPLGTGKDADANGHLLIQVLVYILRYHPNEFQEYVKNLKEDE